MRVEATRRRTEQIIEVSLFAANRPLQAERLAETAEIASAEALAIVIDDLNARYRSENRPYAIQSDDRGVQFALQPYLREEMELKTNSERSTRLNRQLLEVLSLVAYRQPVDESELQDELGVEVGSMLRTLRKRNLIATANAPGCKPKYVTSDRFLKIFGLESLTDLPALADVC